MPSKCDFDRKKTAEQNEGGYRFKSCPGHKHNQNIKHMNTFEQTKAEILLRAKNAGACQTGYKAGLEAQNEQELLKVITDNFYWALNNRVIDAHFLANNFSKEELDKAGIVPSGETKTTEGRLYACGNASVKAWNNVSVVACGNASVEAWNNVSVVACGNASVEAYNNTYVLDYTGNIRNPHDMAIIRDYNQDKIYVKKGAFEIVEAE